VSVSDTDYNVPRAELNFGKVIVVPLGKSSD